MIGYNDDSVQVFLTLECHALTVDFKLWNFVGIIKDFIESFFIILLCLTDISQDNIKTCW